MFAEVAVQKVIRRFLRRVQWNVLGQRRLARLIVGDEILPNSIALSESPTNSSSMFEARGEHSASITGVVVDGMFPTKGKESEVFDLFPAFFDEFRGSCTWDTW